MKTTKASERKPRMSNGKAGGDSIKVFTETVDMNSDSSERIDAHKLFGHFTEDVIKQHRRFVR